MTGARGAGAAAMLAVAVLAGCAAGARPWLALDSAPRLPPPPSPAASAALPSETPVAETSAAPPPPPPNPRKVARQAMAQIVRDLPSDAVSVAVQDSATGATFVYGARGGMWTGSVYKLLVLETLLLERQSSDGWFSSDELADITAMMVNSDNKAGYRMFLDAGGSSALAATVRRLGMRHTVIGGSDPTFTTMSGRDGLMLLDCLVHRGPLRPQSQAFVLSLMRSVESDQRWGAGVLADRGTTFENKNGWLAVDDTNGPGEDDDSRWLVNSLGIVRMHGHQLLVSIFTLHNPDLDAGIRLVERLARIAAPAVLPVS